MSETIPEAFTNEHAIRAALDALDEVSDDGAVGVFLRAEPIDGQERAFALKFECLLGGYPHWEWTAVLGRPGDEAEPTVLEVSLLPGDGALVPPRWIPWSERFAEYQAAHQFDGDDEANGDASHSSVPGVDDADDAAPSATNDEADAAASSADGVAVDGDESKRDE